MDREDGASLGFPQKGTEKASKGEVQGNEQNCDSGRSRRSSSEKGRGAQEEHKRVWPMGRPARSRNRSLFRIRSVEGYHGAQSHRGSGRKTAPPHADGAPHASP